MAYDERILAVAFSLHRAGRLDEADAEYQRLIATYPRDAGPVHYAGMIALQRGDAAQAVELMRKSVEMEPGVALFYNNLGEAFRRLDALDAALKCYERALHLRPDYPAALSNMGDVLRRRHRLGDAIAALKRAVQLAPNFADAYNNLGAAYKTLDTKASEQAYREALRINPGHAESLNNLGALLADEARYTEAEEMLQRAIAVAPVMGASYANLAAARRLVGDCEKAVELLRRGLEIAPGEPAIGSNLLLSMNYVDTLTPEEVSEAHKDWGRRITHGKPKPVRTWRGRDKIRVGYVSGDFWKTSVSYFLQPIITNHDRSKFELAMYADLPYKDERTEFFKSQADLWHDVSGWDDSEVAELVEKDEVDVLVDLEGHAYLNRQTAFARRPAPVQVTYLGYPNTSGLPDMDYRFTDAYADPVGMTEHLHTEKLARLEPCAWCYTPGRSGVDVGPKPVRKRGAPIVFGCYNILAKMSPTVIALWARILKEVEGSKLALKAKVLDEAPGRRIVTEKFAAHGIDPEQLLLWGRDESDVEHARKYHAVDVMLDPFPYQGTTTTCEALYMGLPVISLVGRSHATRVGVSLLSNVGLQDLLATDHEDYVAKAVAIAQDEDRLAHIHSTLRGTMVNSPLCDGPGLTRRIEAFYWQWING